MGELTDKNPKSPPPQQLTHHHHPPGFRFHPTDPQLLSYYLTNKNTKAHQNPNLTTISEIDHLYNYDPYDLPETDSFPYGYGGSKKHWYYFCLNRKGSKRKSKGGFWKIKSRTRNVFGEGNGLLGTKTSFVFYRKENNNSRRCCSRTNWIMIEYALVDHQMDFFVLCRVFLKTCSDNKVIETGLNSHAEEVLEAKEIGEVVVRQDAFDNNFLRLRHQLTTDLNRQITLRPFSGNGLGSSLGALQSDQLVNFSNGFIGNGVTFDAVVADELRTNTIFLEGDYLELDDLVGPLLGFGS